MIYVIKLFGSCKLFLISCRNNGSTTKTEWENPLNRSQLQSVLLNLHFHTNAQVFMVDNMEIVGDMMARLIKATAQKPFKYVDCTIVVLLL